MKYEIYFIGQVWSQDVENNLSLSYLKELASFITNSYKTTIITPWKNMSTFKF